MTNLTEPIRIMVVDDHPAIRRGLRHLLAACKDMIVVGEAEDAQSALRDAQRLRPDVMLVDAHLPGSSKFDVTMRMHGEMPQVRIVLLCDCPEDEQADAESACGAYMCLLKRNVDSGLGETICAAARGAVKD